MHSSTLPCGLLSGLMASSLANRAQDYGNTVENVYGNAYAQAMGQSQGYQNQADAAYNWLNQNPGYTPDELSYITGEAGLNAASTTPEEFASNYLTPAEQAAMMGDTGSVLRAYNPQDAVNTATAGNNWTKAQYQNSYQAAKDAMNQGASGANAALGDYASRLRATVDPSKLGISDAQVQQLKDQAGRQVGLNYAAAQDQLQRQAEAAVASYQPAQALNAVASLLL